MVTVVQYFSNEIEYALWQKKIVNSLELNILHFFARTTSFNSCINVQYALYVDAEDVTWTVFSLIAPKNQIQKVVEETSVDYGR